MFRQLLSCHTIVTVSFTKMLAELSIIVKSAVVKISDDEIVIRVSMRNQFSGQIASP